MRALPNIISERYQIFKKHAEELKNHDKKLDFFACEMIAKRIENKGTLKGFFKNIPNYAYQWFSDYGRSALLPLGCLGGVIGLFSFIFYLLSSCKSFLDSLVLSFAYAFPNFFGGNIRKEYFDKLEFQGIYEYIALASIFIEGLLGLVFIFLIGLALRNRFLSK